jgi:hypothetical protein
VTNKNTLSQITLDQTKRQQQNTKHIKDMEQSLENYTLTKWNKQTYKKIQNNTTNQN